MTRKPDEVRRALRSASLFLLLAVAGCRRGGPSPYSPQDALSTFRLEPGFRIELFASEPDVVDPVAMEFDEDGRIFVVEDSGYPLDVQGKVGRIKLLEDTDGDGRPDRATIFADKLVMPNGVMRWGRGILVTDAPDLLYLEDSDGDRRADVRRVVLTGFAFTNPQHTFNSPLWGLDNWIYLANESPATAVIFQEFADRGSELRVPDRADVPPLAPQGRNIRFRPAPLADPPQIETLSGSTQFGHAFDAWGRHILANNSNHARHEVIAARYLRRNPGLPLAASMQDISDHGAAAQVYPITTRPRFELLTNVGEFTSACGPTLYLDLVFPAEYYGNLFVAEPAHNLVHRDILEPAGATFVARRAREGVEFLASTDAWFRPVNFYAGPDGALYVIDYYRPVVEHPEWMSSEHHHHGPGQKALSEGNDRGRIYRIVPASSAPALPRGIRLGAASAAELARYLEHPGIWWRRTAQRLLVSRRQTDAMPELQRLLASNAPWARLHALWTLEGLGALEDAAIVRALADPMAGIRENAVILAESRPALAATLAAMRDEPDARVRFQLLASLGFQKTPAARAARDRLLLANVDDRWMQVAALSASPEEAARLFELAVQRQAASLLRQTARVIGIRQKPAEIMRVLQTGAAAALEGLAAGLPRATQLEAPAQNRLLALFERADPAIRRAALRVMETAAVRPSPAAIGRAVRVAVDASAAEPARVDALGLLALGDPAAHAGLLRNLVDARQPEEVQRAAVRALGRVPGEDTGAFLIRNWRAIGPAARAEAADALLRDPARTRWFVAALKKGEIQTWTLAFRHKRALIMNADPAIQKDARPLFESTAGERRQVIARYEPALTLRADAATGRAVFERACAKCHRFAGTGKEFGPDLATVGGRTKATLLDDILNPNQALAQGFEMYAVETRAGESYEGLISAQTADSITLRREDGQEDVLRRADIKELRLLNLSAMPADLEKQITVQEMAGLLEFLKRRN